MKKALGSSRDFPGCDWLSDIYLPKLKSSQSHVKELHQKYIVNFKTRLNCIIFSWFNKTMRDKNSLYNILNLTNNLQKII